MPKPRVRIVNESGVAVRTQVFVDDIELSGCVKGVKIRPIGLAGQVEAEVTFVGIEVDIEGDLSGPLLTTEVPPEIGDALPFARHFALLYETAMAMAVRPPAWTSYVFAGRDGTFMVEADSEFEAKARVLEKLVTAGRVHWTEVDDETR